MPSLQDTIELAVELWKAGRLDQSAGILETTLQQAPDNPLALYLLGSIHLHKNAPATAIVLLERSVREDPNADWAWHNLGIAHKQMQDIERAEQCYSKALRINPRREDTMAMVAGCYVNAGNPEPAIEWADKALALSPDDPHAKNHKALALLEMGRWKEGWEYWMNRWEVPERKKMMRDYDCPQWTGGPVDGTIVLHGEQGLGDEILYMSCFDRFIEEVRGNVVIECAKRLVPAFRRSFGVPCYGTQDDVKANEKPDWWVSMGDLPARYLKTEKDFEKQPRKYLYADSMRVDYWRRKIGPNAIGIAWWGGLAKTHSRVRNAPLKYWRDLVGGNFVSVQYETGDTIREAERIGVPHFPEAVKDFDDHLALVDACDTIITVCQTAHHMAGAMGKRCFTLVPVERAFRYGEGQSIWYPSVVQCNKEGDDWGPAFEKVKAELSLKSAA